MLIRILDDAQEVNPYEHLGELVVEADAEARVTLGVDEELVLPVSTTKGKKVYNVVPQGSCPLGSWTYKFYYEEARAYAARDPSRFRCHAHVRRLRGLGPYHGGAEL